MPGCSSSSSGSVRRSRPSPPGNSVAATSAKFACTAANVSAKRSSTVRVEVVAQLLELVEARFEVRALRRELDEPLLLLLVLLLRERVDLAERLAAALEPLDALGELVAVVAFGRLGAGRFEPAARLVRLGLDARALDVDRAEPLGGLGGRRAGARPRPRRAAAAPPRARPCASRPRRRAPAAAPRSGRPRRRRARDEPCRRVARARR